MFRKILGALALCVFSAGLVTAQNATKTYLILATGQGAGSTSFASSLGSNLVAQYDEIGVVVAQSSDPNFATWASSLSGVGQVAEDPDRPWISPNELAIQADSVINDSDVTAPGASSALPLANH